VVGALAVAELIRARGPEVALGGTTWERSAIDPEPSRQYTACTGVRKPVW